MSVNQAGDYVSEWAFRLRQADYKAYGEFLKAMTIYAEECMVALTDAPADRVLNMQGRAHAMRVLVNLLANAKPIPDPKPTAS